MPRRYTSSSLRANARSRAARGRLCLQWKRTFRRGQKQDLANARDGWIANLAQSKDCAAMRGPYLIAAVLAAAQVFSASAETGDRSAATGLNYNWRIAPASYDGQRVSVASRIYPQNSRFPTCPYSRPYDPVLLTFSAASVNLRVLPDGHSLVAENSSGQHLWTLDVSEFDRFQPPPPWPGYGQPLPPRLKSCPVINSLYVEKSPGYIRLGQISGGGGEKYVVWILTSSATAWEIGLRHGVVLESAHN